MVDSEKEECNEGIEFESEVPISSSSSYWVSHRFLKYLKRREDQSSQKKIFSFSSFRMAPLNG